MLRLPLADIVHRNRVIRILFYRGMHVKQDQRHDHFFDLDLIQRAAPFDKVRGGIGVRPPLTNVTIQLREESAAQRVGLFVIPVDGLHRFIGKAGPVWNPRLKSMRQIDELLPLQHLIRLRQSDLCHRVRLWSDSLLSATRETQGQIKQDHQLRQIIKAGDSHEFGFPLQIRECSTLRLSGMTPHATSTFIKSSHPDAQTAL